MEISRIEDRDLSNITTTMKKLKYKKNDGDYLEENTSFYMKLFPMAKKAQNIYESISLFESMTPLIYK